MFKGSIEGRHKRFSVLLFALSLWSISVVEAGTYLHPESVSSVFSLTSDADTEAEGPEIQTPSVEDKDSHHLRRANLKVFFRKPVTSLGSTISSCFFDGFKSLNISNPALVRPGYYLFLFRYTLFEGR